MPNQTTIDGILGITGILTTIDGILGITGILTTTQEIPKSYKSHKSQLRQLPRADHD